MNDTCAHATPTWGRRTYFWGCLAVAERLGVAAAQRRKVNLRVEQVIHACPLRQHLPAATVVNTLTDQVMRDGGDSTWTPQ